MKNSGKSTLAKKIAEYKNAQLVSVDYEIEKLHTDEKRERLSVREINKKYGLQHFRDLETKIINKLSYVKDTIIDCSGSAPLREKNRKILKNLGPIIWLKVNSEINYDRLIQNGIPSFFKYQDNPKRSFDEIWLKRKPVYKQFADYIIEADNENPDEILQKFINLKVKL